MLTAIGQSCWEGRFWNMGLRNSGPHLPLSRAVAKGKLDRTNMTRFLDYQQQDGVAILTMDRPQERNALGEEGQFREFVEVCQQINDDLSVRAVILTGRGKAFCAGGNLNAFRESGGAFAGTAPQLRVLHKRGVQLIPLAMHNLEVPTIAAVNGPAVGAGCDLACMCDIRIASQNASFAESFVKLGLIPGDGGAWLLQRIVGLSKACEMTFTGESINADEALKCGLVSKVVSAEALIEEAQIVARKISANSPEVLRMAKRLIREAQTSRLETILEMSAAFQAISQQTVDHNAAIDGLLEKMKGTDKKL